VKRPVVPVRIVGIFLPPARPEVLSCLLRVRRQGNRDMLNKFEQFLFIIVYIF
jgi:hypothetical protein